MAQVDDLIERLILIQRSLTQIEDMLGTLMTAMNMPSIGLQVLRLGNTRPGDEGQVLPGAMILEGSKARDFYAGLGKATVLPLNDLPPWTHMALAKGEWWLVTMG